MASSEQRIFHPFGPLFGPDSRILILGSFPSVKSREQNFFYGHPQNRFWKVNALVFDQFQLGYYTIGEKVGQAWDAGKEWMKK